MRVRLWGTRGSIPSTLHTPEIEAKLKAALLAAGETGIALTDPEVVSSFVAGLPYALRGTAGGDTSCLEVRSRGNLIIFDCGSGMRLLGQSLMKEEFARGQGVAHIFLCHTHWDHMMGWPYFIPAYIPGNQFYIYGVHPDLEARFRLQQTAPSMFPISLDYQASTKHFLTLQEGETIQIGQTRVRNMRFHHPGDSYGYRVEDDDGVFIYAGDSEYKTLDHDATRHVVEFFRDADALVFDAMFSLRESYQKEDWGHSSAIAGADLATRAGVRRLLLFHHDPYAPDEEIWSLRDQAEKYLEQHPKRPPCQIIVAYDGLELELWRQATLETQIEQQPDGIVLRLAGRLVAETAPIALADLKKVARHPDAPPIAIDLTDVVHLGPKGINVLLSARRHRTGVPIALCGLSSEHRRALTRAGALDHFAIADTPQNALTALHQGLELQNDQMLDDRYKIQQFLNSGRLGDNYLATDRTTGRQVNVLLVCPSLGPAPASAILDAARAAIPLRHPLIADISSAGQSGPHRYVICETVQGQSLRQLLDGDKTSPLLQTTQAYGVRGSVGQALHIGQQIVRALEYAHEQAAVHGALAPDDILTLDDGTIKITQWGIGWMGATRSLAQLPTHLGPLEYLAPEQLQGHGTIPASDLYALGTILYEMLTGSPPFVTADQDENWIALQLRQAPVPPRRRNPSVSRSLDHLIVNLLAKKPQDRPVDASTVSQLLSSLTSRSFRPMGQDQLPGRDSLRRRLGQHLQQTAQGKSTFVLIHGPRGIGKTHLAQTVTEDRQETPLLILRSEVFADEPPIPYHPFVETLQNTLLGLPAHQLSKLLRDLGALAQPLTALMPGLRPAISAYTASQSNMKHLEPAICQIIRQLTVDQPVVLILDGLQWVAAASLGLLHRLVQEQIPRLLIMGLYRTEPNPDTPLHKALNALTPWIDEDIDLNPLGPIDVHQITSTLNAPPDMALWLYSQTDGNPLHIEQLVHLYQDVREPPQRRTAYRAGESNEGPARQQTQQPAETRPAIALDEAILRRLERLPDGTLAILRQASILGHRFPLNQLLSALDQPERQVLDHLDSALCAGIISGHPSEDRYRFGHPVTREAIYADMLSGLRKRYHRRAARALEQEGATGSLDARIDILAHHYLRAGQHEKALGYLARAVRRARTLCAYTSAIDYADKALAVLGQLESTADEDERQHRKKQRADLLAARAQLEAYLTP